MTKNKLTSKQKEDLIWFEAQYLTDMDSPEVDAFNKTIKCSVRNPFLWLLLLTSILLHFNVVSEEKAVFPSTLLMIGAFIVTIKQWLNDLND